MIRFVVVFFFALSQYAVCFQPSTRLMTAASTQRLFSTTTSQNPQHPAVAGWPDKYGQQNDPRGPRILHDSFQVEQASEYQKYQLDVANWPVWTTADKEKWQVGKQNADKIMPYNELSYVISGSLEIVLPSGERFVIKEGDFVTFPVGFQSSWRVLEELTWHYYLY